MAGDTWGPLVTLNHFGFVEGAELRKDMEPFLTTGNGVEKWKKPACSGHTCSALV